MNGYLVINRCKNRIKIDENSIKTLKKYKN